jgi:hypothetical protein
MKKVSSINPVRWLLVAIIGACSLFGFVSCSDDESEMYIDYYLSVQSRYPIYERGGLPLPHELGSIGNLTLIMQEGIREVYPVKNMKGNDNQVISVCDQIYYMYANGEHGASVCTLQLYKVVRLGYLIKERYCLKCYTL